MAVRSTKECPSYQERLGKKYNSFKDPRKSEGLTAKKEKREVSKTKGGEKMRGLRRGGSVEEVEKLVV